MTADVTEKHKLQNKSGGIPSQKASLQLLFGALDKREYMMIIRDNFCKLCIKTYVVTPHLNRLVKTVQMRGHNIWFK